METTLTIADVVYRGSGLARVDGRVIFVQGVLPGETVSVRITREQKNYARAELLQIMTPSPQRITPVCPLAARPAGTLQMCVGCAYQHVKYEEEIRLKQAQFVNLMERAARIGEAVFLPPVMSPEPTGYRNKIVLHGGPRGRAPILGYFGEDNETVVDVQQCPLAVVPINDLLRRTRGDRTLMESLKPDSRVTFRYTEKDGAICWIGKCGAGAPWLTETAGPLGTISVPCDSFAQVNPPVAAMLVSNVIELLRQDLPAALVDLYCGTGLFSLAAAAAGVGRVLGVDSDARAIRAAEHNALGRGHVGSRFAAATAIEGLSDALRDVNPADTALIVDPTRMGLDKDTVRIMAGARFRTIIYVSCAADTLARDTAVLVKAGYSVKSAQLFDMFPRTPYFESITCLVRNAGGG